MRRGSWWKSSLYPILLVLALLAGTFSAQAQTASDDADEEVDAKPTPSLSLNIVFSDAGSVQVTFFAFGRPSTSSEIKSALESSLGCTLHDITPPLRANSQFYSGSCEPSSERTSMVLEFKIRTAPLRKYAADHQIEMLSLAVRLPDADITETEPPVRTPTLPFKKMTVSLERLSELHRRYSWRIDSAIPDFVTVRFGLSSKSVARAKYTQIRAVTGANPRFNSGKVFSELFVTA